MSIEWLQQAAGSMIPNEKFLTSFPFTIGAWVKIVPDAGGISNNPIFGGGSGSPATNLELTCNQNDGQPSFQVAESFLTHFGPVSNAQFPLEAGFFNDWRQVVGTWYEDRTTQIYLNGVKGEIINSSGPDLPEGGLEEQRIGANYLSGGEIRWMNQNSLMADFTLWNRSFDDQEIGEFFLLNRSFEFLANADIIFSMRGNEEPDGFSNRGFTLSVNPGGSLGVNVDEPPIEWPEGGDTPIFLRRLSISQMKLAAGEKV